MRGYLVTLGAKYAALCLDADVHVHNQASSQHVVLLNYSKARSEMERLRQEQLWIKAQIIQYDRFTGVVESLMTIPKYLNFQAPAVPINNFYPLNHPLSPTFTPLSTEICHRIIRECYQTIFHPQRYGERISSGAQFFGWLEERYVDGTCLEFFLTKSLPFVSPLHLMEKTWTMLTTFEGLRTIQPSALGVSVLQIVNHDSLVVEWKLDFRVLLKITTVRFFIFRLQTKTGYVVALKILKGLTEAEQPNAYSEFESAKKNGKINGLQWYIFEEQPLGNDDNCTEGLEADDMDTVSLGDLTECKITRGGRIDEKNEAFLRFYIIEVLSIIVRWDQAVAAPKLPFFTLVH